MLPEHVLKLVDIDTVSVAVASIAASIFRVHDQAVAVAVHMFRQLSNSSRRTCTTANPMASSVVRIC